MAATARQWALTEAEYLTQERTAQYKSEYLNGQVYAMAGASPEHNQIVRNVLGELYVQLKGTPCEPLANDMRVRVTATGLNTYPDVLVVCDPMSFYDEKGDTLTNPSIIIEILSDSTEAYDRGAKFAHYQRITTLHDYVLVSQKLRRVEQFTRQPDNRWLLTTVTEPEEQIHLASINAYLRVSDVYDRLRFDAHDPATENR